MSYIDFNGQTMAIGRASYGGDSSDVSGDLSGVVNIYSTVGAFAALRNDGSVVTWGGIEGLMAYNYWTADTSSNLIYLPESGGASRVGVNVLNPSAFLDASGSFYLGEHSSWDFTGVDFAGSDLYGRSSGFSQDARRNVRKIITGERFTLALYNNGTVRFFTTASIASLGGLVGISGETDIVDIATQNYTVPVEDTCIVATYRDGRAKAWTYTNTEPFIEDLSNSTLFFKAFSVGSTFYLGTHKIICVGYGSSNSTSIAAQYFRNATEYTVQVLNLLIENHRQIEIGQNFVATLRNDGTILMYFVYDLFDNNRFSNVAYGSLRNIVKISCGKDHVLALDSSGTAYAYAHNLITDDRITGVGSLSVLSGIYMRPHVKDVYAGGEFSVLLLEDNTIVACGTVDISSGSYSNKLAIFAGNDTVFMKEQVEHNRLNGYTLIRDHVHIGENHGLFSEENALTIYDVNRSGLPGSIYLGGNGNRNYSRIILGDNSISPSPIQTLWSIEHKRGNLAEDHHFRLGFYKDGIENNVLTADTCGNIRLGYTEDLEYYPYRLSVNGSEYIDGDLSITGTTQFGSGFRFANNVLFVSGTQVGIMTSSPSSGITLDVNGSQRITGDIIVIGNADFRNQVSFSSGFSVGNFFSVSPVGVGIGKINPNVALDVVGSATISTDIQAESANITTSITTPRIGLGRSNARYPLDVSGRGFVGGNMEIGGLASIGKTITGTTALDVSGASIVSGNMTIGKTTETPISGLDVSGSTLVSGRMTIGKSALTTGIALDVSGTTVLSGNVGIGKTMTSNALDVSGTVFANTLSATSIVGTISTASQPNITSVGTLGSLNVSGTILATTICGTTLTGTISTVSQPNITTIGTLGSLNVSGTSGLIGNVGIGRTATSNTVDVSGNARITGTTTICGTLFVNDISGFRGSQWETSGNTISYRTGNVGIGTSIPTTSLDVSGNARITGTTTICGTLFVRDISGFTGSQWETSGNTISYRTGNVGIGTSIPSASLDVSGTTRITGSTTICGTLFVNDISGFTGSQWTSTGNNIFYRTGSVGIGKTDPSSSFVLDVSGNVSICGTIISSSINASNSILADLSLNTSMFQVGTIGGATLYANLQQKRVGIGMTNPSVALDVAGTVNASTLSGTISTASQPNITSVGNLSSLRVSGNVGIGLTNPVSSFQISLPDATAGNGTSLGDVGAWDSTYALISQTTSTSGSGAGALGFGYNSSFGSGVITCLAPGDSWKNIYYRAANHIYFGNVGIETTTPASTLDVAGTARIRGTTTICGTLFVRDISGVSLGGTSQWTTSGNNISYITGNVGIGKTNPTSTLDILGKLSISNSSVYTTSVNIDPSNEYTYSHTWTTRTSAADNNWSAICWSPQLSLFVAVGNSGTGNRVMTSSDGITWTTRTSAADNIWRAVTWSPELSLFVATGDSGSGNRVMTSSNGINWTTRSTVGIDNNYYGIAWSPNLSLFVIVGAGNVLTSSNGIDWYLRSLPNSFAFFYWMSVCWSPQLLLFAAVAQTSTNGTSVMTSPDGINWTGRSTTGFDNGWQSICWSPQLSLFVAVANTGTGNRVMTSSNGINWATQNTTGLDNMWQSVCWSEELSLFVAVSTSGTGNRVMTSPNGTTWTLRTSPVNNSWQSVCWSPQLSLFAAVSNDGTGNRVMTSSATVIPSNNFGSCYLYSTPNSIGRGIIPSVQYFRRNTNLVGQNSASAQTLLGAGVLLASNTVYEFEGLFDLSRSATTSATISLSFDTSGGMVVNNILYHVITTTTDNSANTATTSTMTINTTSAIAITGALALSHRFVINRIVGTISIGSTGGRLTPMYTVSTNAFSFNTRAGSFFKIWPIGASGSNISIGNWA